MKKVVVGISGGIDSSVAALLLKKQGYEVIGITLKHLNDELANSGKKSCCSLDDINDARITCFNLGIPHYVIDVSEEFKNIVIDDFINKYNQGITPSPCIICDEKVKMKKLLDFARIISADYVATGHYVVKNENNEILLESKNPKDQGYMLYRLSPDILKYFIFPLTNMKKEDVRKIAKENGISIFNKKDSQGICFAQNGYIEFLKSELGDKIKEGNFIDKDGNIIGKHQGYQLYTIGQRRNLGLNLGKPYFIKKILPQTNEIILSDFEDILVDEVKLINTKFYKPLDYIVNKELFVKPRFSSKGQIAYLQIKNGEVYIKYKEKNCENSNGQHLVIYLDKKIVGGGEIEMI